MTTMIYLQDLSNQEKALLPTIIHDYAEPVVVCGSSPKYLHDFVTWLKENPNKPFRKLIIPFADGSNTIGDYLLTPLHDRKPIRSTIRSFVGKQHKFAVSPVIKWTENIVDEYFSWPIPEDYTTNHIIACSKMPSLRAFLCNTIDGLSDVQRLAFSKTPGYFKSICLSVANELYLDYDDVCRHLSRSTIVNDIEVDYLPRVEMKLPFLHVIRDLNQLTDMIIKLLDFEPTTEHDNKFLDKPCGFIHENRYVYSNPRQCIRLFLSLQVSTFKSIEYQEQIIGRKRLLGIAIYNMRDELFNSINKQLEIERSNTTTYDPEELLNTEVRYVSPFSIAEHENNNTLSEFEQLKLYISQYKHKPQTL